VRSLRYLSHQLASGREASYPSPGLKPTVQPDTKDTEYKEQVYSSTRPAPVHGSNTIACQRDQLECTQHRLLTEFPKLAASGEETQ
jgi:hypothetical protein